MNMKTFSGVGEHARGRPLPGPELQIRQNSLVAPGEFSEQSPMPLHVNGARKTSTPGIQTAASERRFADTICPASTPTPARRFASAGAR